METNNLLKYLIIFLCTGLVIMLVAAAWLFWSPPPEAPIVEPVASSTPPNPDYLPSPTESQQPSTSTPVDVVAEGDVAAQYRILYEGIGATKVQFTSTTNGEIYNLYAADIADSQKFASSSSPLVLKVAMLDLNADKTSEAIVYEDIPDYCGAGGCAIDVWQKNNGTWKKILEGLGYETIGVMQSTTGGYKNLTLSVHGDIGSMTKIVEYVFKDGSYQEWNLRAVWNGSTFAIPQ